MTEIVDEIDGTQYFHKGSDTLTFAFTSHLRTPRFDWKLLRKERFDTDVVLVRDMTNSWYFRGIHNLTNDIGSTVKYLTDFVDGYKRIVFIGSSMGGFAALLFGWLVQHPHKEIHAFGPQVRLENNDNAWIRNKVKENVLPYISNYDKLYLRLDEFIDLPDDTYIHYAQDNDDDKLQSSLLDCRKLMYPIKEHEVAVYLLNSGGLIPMIDCIYRPV